VIIVDISVVSYVRALNSGKTGEEKPRVILKHNWLKNIKLIPKASLFISELWACLPVEVLTLFHLL